MKQPKYFKNSTDQTVKGYLFDYFLLLKNYFSKLSMYLLIFICSEKKKYDKVLGTIKGGLCVLNLHN